MVDFILDETHDAKRKSWVESAIGHPEFPVQNLPLGVFSPTRQTPRGGIAIGDEILDLSMLAQSGLLSSRAGEAAKAGCGAELNALLALESDVRRALRREVSELLSNAKHRVAVAPMLHAASNCTHHLPAQIRDYTDFYAGIHHATNVGSQFRPDNPLLPNYKHVPIGYHGRASSVVQSGTPLRRPSGQTKASDSDAPTFGPSERLDYELELGIWIGSGNALGDQVSIDIANEAIAGICLLNDWSARDIQAWEYQPLGPFLSKSFMTTVSPWIVTAEAIAPFRIAQPRRPESDPRPLAYLWDEGDQRSGALAATLKVQILTTKMRDEGLPPTLLSTVDTAHIYWTIAQLVTHHSAGGCNLNTGDLFGTGTISGPSPDSFGSLLEITSGGREPAILPNGETRRFLENGDEIIFSGQLTAPGYVPIGFGECRGIVVG